MLRDSGTILDYDDHAGTSARRGVTVMSLPNRGVPGLEQYFLPLHDAHFDISSVDVVETSTY